VDNYFFRQAEHKRFTIVLSDVTLNELQNAPEKVQDLPVIIPPEFIEPVTITDEQFTPAGHYVTEGVWTQKFYSDVQHIAIATILKGDRVNFFLMLNAKYRVSITKKQGMPCLYEVRSKKPLIVVAVSRIHNTVPPDLIWY
jgi:hypothetical protein